MLKWDSLATFQEKNLKLEILKSIFSCKKLWFNESAFSNGGDDTFFQKIPNHL